MATSSFVTILDPRKILPKDPEPIFLPILYFLKTRSSLMEDEEEEEDEEPGATGTSPEDLDFLAFPSSMVRGVSRTTTNDRWSKRCKQRKSKEFEFYFSQFSKKGRWPFWFIRRSKLCAEVTASQLQHERLFYVYSTRRGDKCRDRRCEETRQQDNENRMMRRDGIDRNLLSESFLVKHVLDAR